MLTNPRTQKRLLEIAQGRFGFEELRPGQAEAMTSILAGRDTLVVMPTGAGKSAIYQIPALLIEGMTLVVSPLIALQRDQVESLHLNGDRDAAQLNSTLSAREREEAFEALSEGSLEFLFVAPEQLSNDETLGRLKRFQPSLLVVDEAHCISAWGHDFRPDYLRLGEMATVLGRPPILALTATASPLIRDEIVERLGMDNPTVVVHGFDRPNIGLHVNRFVDERSKREALLEAASSARFPGVVYVATKRTAEELAGELWQRGVTAVYYHGGMSRTERERAQESFMRDEFDVVVATTAFGMGIDKPNVRFVYHYDIADSLDSYYQEIGRSGRDGEPAEAVLYFRQEDLGIRRFFAATGGDALEDERRQKLEDSRLDMMRAYAETRGCRRRFLLNYFGEPYEGPCGNCDNCIGGRDEAREGVQPFDLNARVKHMSWGEGSVIRYEEQKVTVLFDEVGYKTLSVALIEEKGLLELVEHR